MKWELAEDKFIGIGKKKKKIHPVTPQIFYVYLQQIQDKPQFQIEKTSPNGQESPLLGGDLGVGFSKSQKKLIKHPIKPSPDLGQKKL